jgi:hypothetical protein
MMSGIGLWSTENDSKIQIFQGSREIPRGKPPVSGILTSLLDREIPWLNPSIIEVAVHTD